MSFFVRAVFKGVKDFAFNQGFGGDSFFPDRVNEFSDEDEEIEFSSGEYDGTNAGSGLTGYDAKRGYACKRDMRKFRKIDQTENDGEPEDGALGTNPVDSDSEFENIKDKGSRAKISRVSYCQ